MGIVCIESKHKQSKSDKQRRIQSLSRIHWIFLTQSVWYLSEFSHRWHKAMVSTESTWTKLALLLAYLKYILLKKAPSVMIQPFFFPEKWVRVLPPGRLLDASGALVLLTGMRGTHSSIKTCVRTYFFGFGVPGTCPAGSTSTLRQVENQQSSDNHQIKIPSYPRYQHHYPK